MPASGDDDEWSMIANMACGLFEAAEGVFPSGSWQALVSSARTYW